MKLVVVGQTDKSREFYILAFLNLALFLLMSHGIMFFFYLTLVHHFFNNKHLYQIKNQTGLDDYNQYTRRLYDKRKLQQYER